MKFRSAAMRRISSSTWCSEARSPRRWRASSSIAATAAKLSLSALATTVITASASENSIKPRSSRRLTIARARNSMRLAVALKGPGELKHHLRAEGTAAVRIPDQVPAHGVDPGHADGGRIRNRAVIDEHPHSEIANRLEDGHGDGSGLVDLGDIAAQGEIHRHSHRADAIARAEPVQRVGELDVRRLDTDERRQERRSHVAREPEARRRVALIDHPVERTGDHPNVMKIERPHVDQRARSVADEREVNALRLIAPAPALPLVFGDALGDDQSFDARSDVVNRTRRLDDAGRIDMQRRPSFGPARERLPVFDRYTTLGYTHDRAVLPTRNCPTFAVDHRVTISGAEQGTTSSCPSREQITPG